MLNYLRNLSRFESVDAAEKCIESLRRYRNLHPSFSKVCPLPLSHRASTFNAPYLQQVHKIPGTHYASTSTSASASTNTATAEAPAWRRPAHSSSASSDIHDLRAPSEAQSHSSEELASFRARMERLGDQQSTNLYIEGCVHLQTLFRRHADAFWVCQIAVNDR